MVKYKHVINLSEMAVDKINAPEGSPFEGLRQRVGAHIARKNLATVSSACLREGRLSRTILTAAMKK